MKLEDPIGDMPGVGPANLQKLKRLGIKTIEDLLMHIPSRHVDFSNKVEIKNLVVGEQATVIGQVVSAENVYAKSGKVFQVVRVSDGKDSLEAVWMRQPWMVKTLRPGNLVSLSGKLGFWGKKRAMMFPVWEKYSGENLHTGRLVPIYPETAGLSSRWLRRLVANALAETKIDDFIEDELEFLSLHEAIYKAHMAETEEEFVQAYNRLSFDELLMLQVENNLKKLWWRENTRAPKLEIDKAQSAAFLENLPFKLTDAQSRAVEELLADLKNDIPANRLLSGDVGSGKTVVAAAGVFASFVNARKSVIMAPTQILAQQHYLTIKQILSPFNARVELVTSDGVSGGFGSSDVVVGTHALLFGEDFVKDAAFLVIDEQHRFGVKQRGKIAELAAGKDTPHVLTMTATPIPRTIALTIYGDLDLSTLDELPVGRQKITTWVVPSRKRAAAEKWIEAQIAENGAQVFVVCPLIEESEAESMQQVKAATKEYERLKKVFPRLRLALLHGRMKAKEKNKIISEFRNREFDILVSTPVIEVGIDIPEATIMVIEAAERFGLAQLHQLRGRVGRGSKKSYCLLFSESHTPAVSKRLEALVKAKSGRELAEMDLEIRGPGELLGIRQSGVSELKIARWNDMELIKKSREFADKVVSDQKKYKKVLEYYKKKQKAPN